MKSLVFNLLNIKQKEVIPVSLLLAQGFFMGIFIANYKVTAETIFLQNLGESYLPLALTISGLVGVISTYLFAQLQSKISFKLLVILSMASVFVNTALMWGVIPYVENEIISYIMFVMLGPFQAVLLLGFWGVFGRMFDLRQAKRIIGGIDTGQLSAAILAYFTIPFLAEYLNNIYDLLILSSAGILLSLLFLAIICGRYNLDMYRVNSEEVKRETRFRNLIRNRYIGYLSLFLIFSMVASYFIDFSFLTVTQRQYPSETDLASFLAVFNGAIMILSFLIQTFVNDRIIGTYGIKISLLILPFILGVFTLASIFFGNLYGTFASSSGFIWFFLSVALSKLFTSSLRDALENPTFKLYFMPMDTRIRFDIQTKVEGVIGEFSRLLAGGFILLLGTLYFIELIHYSYFLVLILVGWVFVTGRLYGEYSKNVKKKLEQQKKRSETIHNDENLIKSMLVSNLDSRNVGKVIFSIKLLDKLDQEELRKHASKVMKHSRDEIRKFGSEILYQYKGYSSSNNSRRVFQLDKGSGSDELVKYLQNVSDEESKEGFNFARINELGKSKNPEDRKYAAELIAKESAPQLIGTLVELLRDINAGVRVAAIITAQKTLWVDIIPYLIENLNHPACGDAASGALSKYKEAALPVLEKSFHKTGQNAETMLQIVKVYGRIGGDKAIDLLWNKVDFPDKQIVQQVLLSLGLCRFVANGYQETAIKNAIEQDIMDISWNLAAMREIRKSKKTQVLREAIREENESNKEHIFMLLSMIFDPHSIQLIKDNLETGTSEGITYAIELLEVFLTEDFRERIIPILDDTTDDERLKKLQQYYPREELSEQEVLRQIINRDFHQISYWTKGCALMVAAQKNMHELVFDMIANLFHPEKLLREIAAWSLNHLNEDLFTEHVERLPQQSRQLLYQKIVHKDNALKKGRESLTIYEKTLFLKKTLLFNSLPGSIMSGLAENIAEHYIDKTAAYRINENDSLLFIYKGVVELYKNNKLINSLREGDFIGELFISEGGEDKLEIKAMTSTILLKLEKVKFYNFLSNELEIGRKVISFVSKEDAFENSATQTLVIHT
ncbi:hypothetical protein AB9P05_20730 [Roseivirga sp. BDSF3-8]|uniref:hypothetical protein n=1 Tax=Roseivirga sp. BDSF3-8 TaxID=3241598 RepID=UPI0035323869